MRASLLLFVILGVFAITSAATVDNAHKQCQAKQYVGACFEQKIVNLATICENLKCASFVGAGRSYREVLAGPALPGTICGVSKMCNKRGKCVPTLNVPHQVGPSGTYHCK